MSFLTNASQAMSEVNTDVAETINDLLVKELGYSTEVADFWSKALARKDGAMHVYADDIALKMGIVYYNNQIFDAQVKVTGLTEAYAEFLLSYMEKNSVGFDVDLKDVAFMLTPQQTEHLKRCIENCITTQRMTDHRQDLVKCLDERLKTMRENAQQTD